MSETGNNAAARHQLVLGARTLRDIRVWGARKEAKYLSPEANEAK
jgi:hypothetical protein